MMHDWLGGYPQRFLDQQRITVLQFITVADDARDISPREMSQSEFDRHLYWHASIVKCPQI